LITNVLLNHVVFAAAILGLAVALAVVLMAALFFRHVVIEGPQNAAIKRVLPSLRTGGVAIFGAFIAGISLIHLLGSVSPIKAQYFWGFFLSLVLIGTTSLANTIRPLPRMILLTGQFFSIVSVMGVGIVIDELPPWTGYVVSGWSLYPLTFAWIFGLTKIYGQMDGMDGLAASTAVVASAFFGFIAFDQNSPFIYLCSVALFAGSLGFLIFNWPPAKINMGDIGSTFLGFSFAVMAIIAGFYDRSHTSLLVIPLLLFHFIFDIVFTFFCRTLPSASRKSQQRPYLYQLLHGLGYSRAKVIFVYSGMATAQGLAAIWMVNISGSNRILVFISAFIVHLIYARWITLRARSLGLV
jgi:UDP-GlcNAc:undecaprenyl-phosphate GlcNAc-1-phosphate transferase